MPGLIPAIGIPFAIMALRYNAEIERRRGAQWNPASRQLFWGVVCARIGFYVTIILAVFASTTLIFTGR